MDLDEASLLNATAGDFAVWGDRLSFEASPDEAMYAGIWDGAEGYAEKRPGSLLLQPER